MKLDRVHSLYFFLGLALFFTSQGIDIKRHKAHIKVNFSNCPRKPANNFVIQTSKIFEQNKSSLRAVKKEITEKKLQEKHYLSSYKLHYNPISLTLEYHFHCSTPLLKLSAMSKEGMVLYDIVLSEDGKTHDPSYLVYWSENDFNQTITKAALPVDKMSQINKEELVFLAKKAQSLDWINLTEMIFSHKNELTLINKKKGKITSIFLGQGFWEKKLEKLDKIMKYMEKEKKIPSMVNLTNLEKIVIKI